MQSKREWLRHGFVRKAGSEARSLSFMYLAAPHDAVVVQKDQANTAYLLHGYGLTHTWNR